MTISQLLAYRTRRSKDSRGLSREQLFLALAPTCHLHIQLSMHKHWDTDSISMEIKAD